MWVQLIFLLVLGEVLSADLDETDDSSRKILGSSVVTSVSVILDSGNGNKASFADAVGKPVAKPQMAKLASPIELLNPDRYEFYTFDESGDLVKRLMTMDEIKAIIATSGDDVFNIDNFSDIIPENRVNDIVSNVQNVLREEIEAHKMPDTNQLFDTPDVSDSWSMILPAIFGNSGEEIKAEKTATASTPETLVIGTTQTETTMTKSTSTTPTTAISPISSFTNYFTHPTSTDASHIEDRISAKTTTTSHVGLSTGTISSSNRNITTTKFVSSKPPSYNTTPTDSNEMSTTTESNILKVQIFPNSNTNSESPYITSITGGTQPDSEYVRISTPRPQPLLQSRISNTILEKTSPSVFTRVTAGITTKPSLPQASTLPIHSTKSPYRIPTQTSSFATKPTGPLTSTKTEPDVKINSTNNVKLTSQTIIEPTTEKENKIFHTSVLPSIADSTISQPTEKIYILLRPLTSTTRTTHVSTKPTSQSSHTTPSKTTIKDKITSYAENYFQTFNSNESTSTKSIFTIISEKPSVTVIPVTPQTISHFENNLTSAQPDVQYVSNISDSKTNSYKETSKPTSLQTDGYVVTTISAEILSKDSTSKNVNSTNYTDQTTPSISYKQQDVANVSSTLASTTSEQQNTGSLFKNKHESSTATQSDYSKTTESTPYSTEVGQTSSDDAQTTEPLSTFTGIQKDILEKLLLSSTNVYEINSAVTQDLTYPAETTSLSGETSTDYPSSESISPVQVNPTLIESLGQLLAQAVANVSDIIPENAKLNNQYGNDPLGSTTTSKAESFDPSSNFYQPTTYLQNYESTKSSIDAGNTEEGLIPSTENVYAGGNTLLNKFNNFDDDQHVINISIFKNQNSSKPAKADLSLEIDYDLLSLNHTEMQKLSTGIQDASTIPFDSKISTQSTTPAASTPNIENEFTNFFNMNTSSATTHEGHYTLTTLDRTTNSNAEFTTHLDETAATEKITYGPTTSVTTTTMNSTWMSPSLNESEDSWTLVSTIAPHGKVPTIDRKPTLAPILEPTPTVNLEVNPMQGFGLEESTAKLDADVYQFVQLCNELAFGFWKSVTTGISSARSVIVSPFAATSLLAMVFLGARGSTSGEMNEILKLDNMVTFNPHLTFKSVTESILTGPDTGVATSAIVRQLYSDRSKEKILNFYKERAKFFYDGHVEEVSFKAVGDTIRRRTNLLIKKHTNGKIQEFLKDGSVRVRPPLAAISGSVMQTDCTKGSINDRDGEIHFVVFPSIKQKRLIPIPAIVYREGFLAGYEPSLDATAVALGDKDNTISFIFVLPGRQGINALGDGLSRLEKRLVESSFQKGAWARLLRTLVPRPELEVQIPRFSHRSIINATAALKHMGLTTLFDINKADLRGLNGVAHDLHLSDMLQFNHFSLCGNANTGHGHHSEYYPATARRSLRKHRRLDQFEQQKILHDDPLYIINYLSLPLNLRPRQARVPQIPRLRLDRPFLYFVRHNPTGFILHMGRFNPRLIP
ncbi:hypothetical protein WA026_018793 [Henosepilachna vigintioctopunctata]|uniref:Serpin domain-containing protein n=1 Tax=Henosepilachna vigintioctopunctata TaxID=420089 RepID=A0AAW1TPC4_9CUCU